MLNRRMVACRVLTARKLAATWFVVIATTSCILTGVEPATAGVNLKNGNFYISYTDLIVGEPEFNLSRTYNSKASRTLLYGTGWGSRLDTFLTVNGDGTVTVHEYGSGQDKVYSPPELSREALDAVLGSMMAAMERAGWIASDEAATAARRKLFEDSEHRRRVQTMLVKGGMLPAPQITTGTRLSSPGEHGTYLVRERTSYYRRVPEGFERFDLNGRIVQSEIEGQASYRLKRDADGNLEAIVLGDGVIIKIETNQSGRIIRAEIGKNTATYKYNDRNQLLETTDVIGNRFRYEYDDQSNMTAIRYVDDSAMEMTYDKKGYIASLKSRKGSLNRYDYGNYAAEDPGVVKHYYTRVREYSSDDDQTPRHDRLTAYKVKRDAFGNHWTAEILRVVDGVETETHYHPCGSPTLQRRGKRKTVYDYDDSCHLTLKRTATNEIRLDYDPRSGKISRVATVNLVSKKRQETSFNYDLRGNLKSAERSDGKQVSLTYDNNGQIASMLDDQDQTLRFVYNKRGKPVKITIEGSGTIDVTYDSNGEIAGVKSKAGHKMALKVTQAFQSLLALVKPAGVNFNF